MKTAALFLALAACGGSPFSAASEPADAGTGDVTPDATPDAFMPPDTAPLDVAPDVGPICSTPTSPALTGTGGASGTGLQFHVSRDVVLTSFNFTGAGQSDTITLSDDSCNTIESASVPGVFPPNYTPYLVNVRWKLRAGVTYRLTNLASQVAVGGPVNFPYVTGVLTVENGITQCPVSMQPFGGSLWVAFTDLTFCDPGDAL